MSLQQRVKSLHFGYYHFGFGMTLEAFKIHMQKYGIHKNCAHCGKFVPKKRWLAKKLPQNPQPLCDPCARECDPGDPINW